MSWTEPPRRRHGVPFYYGDCISWSGCDTAERRGVPVPFPAVNAFDRHPPPSFPAHLTVILVQTVRRDVRGHRPRFRGLCGGPGSVVCPPEYVLAQYMGAAILGGGLRTDQRSRDGRERHKHQTANAAAGTTISIEARIRGRLRLGALFHCLSEGSTDLLKHAHWRRATAIH